MTAQITLQGYDQDGLFVQAVHHQDTFPDFDAVKVKANELWKEFKATKALPYVQMFISDTEKQKNIYYHANFH